MSERDRPINASKELISNKIKRKSAKENFIHILDAFEILGVQIADLNARISALEDEHFIKRKKTIVHQNVNGVVQYDANDVRYSKSLAKSLDDLREYFQHVGFRLVREDTERKRKAAQEKQGYNVLSSNPRDYALLSIGGNE